MGHHSQPIAERKKKTSTCWPATWSHLWWLSASHRLLAWGVLLLVCLPLVGQAACLKSEPDTLWNYNGTLGNGLRVRMTLVLGGEQVSGLYFYASQLKDIALRGRISEGTVIVLDELDANGQVVGRFEGHFADHDPQGRYGDRKLECEVIVGVWSPLNAAKQLPVYLSLESGTIGSLTQRYAPAGAQDDALIHRSALAFWQAVKRGDKKAVAGMVAYPIKVQLPTGPQRLRSAAELVANYDAIFSPRYRDAIAAAMPRNMFVRDQGIMLGQGEVWFGADGKVIALNDR